MSTCILVVMDNKTEVDGALVARNLLISDRTYEALRDLAHEQRTSISELVRDALGHYEPLRKRLVESPTPPEAA